MLCEQENRKYIIQVDFYAIEPQSLPLGAAWMQISVTTLIALKYNLTKIADRLYL